MDLSQPSTVSIEPGQVVRSGDDVYTITARSGLDTVYARHNGTGEHEVLSISELTFATETQVAAAAIDLADIPEAAREGLRRRGNVIRELCDLGRVGLHEAKKAADELGVSFPTIYRWVKKYRETRRLSSLLPSKPNGGRGRARIDPEVDGIVKSVIENFYLTKQQRSIKDTHAEVARVCRAAGKPAPTYETIRLRIQALPPRLRLERRAHKKLARDKFLARGGLYDEARFPLAIVQIDHTPLDIMVVDRVLRRSIGRPTITAAIDVFSRMIVGFVITLEPPSANTVGLCIRHAALPKDAYLSRLGVTNEWPCWGVPHAVHTDNAKEFRGEMLATGCEEYGINLFHRPVQSPHFAGVVERFFRTLNGMLHSLPGSTSSNPKERGEYDSDSEAVLTLDELEKTVTEWITGVYHRREHKGLLGSPLQKWRDGILGDDKTPAPAQRKPGDEERFSLYFTPLERRTLQHHGFVIDNIWYYGDVLRPYIANMRKKSRVYQIRQDPQDISYIYMWDREIGQHFRIPYRDQSRPAMTLWELRAVRAEIKRNGSKHIDEAQIFATYDRMRAIEASAVVETKRMRRMRERRTVAAARRAQPTTHVHPPTGSVPADTSNVIAFAPRISLSNVVPYEMDDDV